MFQLFQRPTCPLLRDSSELYYEYNTTNKNKPTIAGSPIRSSLFVVLHETQNISNDLQHRYIKSAWLTPIGTV